jgi:hypothetical protein
MLRVSFLAISGKNSWNGIYAIWDVFIAVMRGPNKRRTCRPYAKKKNTTIQANEQRN